MESKQDNVTKNEFIDLDQMTLHEDLSHITSGNV